MLAMEGKYHSTPSGPSIDEGPRDVLYLITTAKYQNAQKRINNFLNSALVPDSIKAPLVEFNKTIGVDIEIMTRALNARMNENDDYFLKYNEIGSKYYKVLNHDYVTRFVSIKPKADAVLSAISRHWRTN